MSKQHYQILFAYCWHTTEQLLDKAALLDESDLHADSGNGHGSIHGIFFHLLATLRGWRIGLETGVQPPRLQPDGFESLITVRAGLAEENERWQTLVAALNDAEVDGPIASLTKAGDPAPLEYWRAFQHLILHNMQHYSEIAKMLTDKGQSPGDLDFIFYGG
jgi:uncharacterized damage-inducible protein DinB